MMSIEIISIAFASLSAACSASIVLTGLVFPSMMLSPLHPFSNILFMIALCDMLGSVGFSLGFPTNGSVLCTTQSFLNWFFTPASWIWSTALVYQMHCIIVYRKLQLSMTHLHIIIWTLTSLIAFLPLIQEQYGQDDDYSGNTFCFVKCLDLNCFIWVAALYQAPLQINIILMVTYLCKIWRYLSAHTDDGVGREKILFKSLCWYPIGLIACWTFNLVIIWIIFLKASYTAIENHVAFIMATQYGTVCCIIFFSSSSLVRRQWIDLLTGADGHHIESTSEADQSEASRHSFLSDVKDVECTAYYARESVVVTRGSNGTADMRDRVISRESEMAVYRQYDITTNALNSELHDATVTI